MDVVFYRGKKGDEPAREFVDSLEPKMQAKMLRLLLDCWLITEMP